MRFDLPGQCQCWLKARRQNRSSEDPLSLVLHGSAARLDADPCDIYRGRRFHEVQFWTEIRLARNVSPRSSLQVLHQGSVWSLRNVQLLRSAWELPGEL
jgi:hypothetical protein